MNIKALIKQLKPQWKEYGFILPTKLCYYSAKKNDAAYVKCMRRYIDKKYGSFISNYPKYYEKINKSQSILSKKIIWSIWWQGEINLPEVVQKARKSLQEKCGDYQIILVNKDNIKEYLDIPDYILSKVESGNISFVHMADYIRVSLLEKFGGIWLDATVFLTDVLPNTYLDYPFFSRHLSSSQGVSASNGRWSGYYMASGYSHTFLFSFLHDFYNMYWKKHDTIVTYLLLDYLIDAAYRHFPEVKKTIDDMPVNNEEMKFLQNHMNAPFNADEWTKVCQNTVLQKLSWKVPIENKSDSYYQIICG